MENEAGLKKIFDAARLLVVKIGTNVLTASDCALDTSRIKKIVSQVSSAVKDGRQVILVSSGAITAGRGRLGLKNKTLTIPEEQAAAAVGQGLLMSVYTEHFAKAGLTAAQVLLTQADLRDRKRYVNARNTLMMLLGKGAVPVVNENDTVAVDELVFGDRFGDNDILSALVANLAGADLLIMLTDVPGLYSRDDVLIRVVDRVTPRLDIHLRRGRSSFGKGGMENKLKAAKIVSDSGITAVIAGGREEDPVSRILAGEPLGTVFLPGEKRIYARKRWIAFALQPRGAVIIDRGACRALENGKSLLPGGIVGVEKNFGPGDSVSIKNEEGEEIARGISSYSSPDILKIKRLKSSSIKNVLGAQPCEEVVHRDNMTLLKKGIPDEGNG